MHKFEKSGTWGYSQIMIYIIWLIWMFNQIFNLIILLNFLIAIVSQSYDRVISASIQYQYKHKSELNLETQRFFHMFSKPKPFDIMCIVSKFEESMDSGEYGFTNVIKNYIRAQIQELTNTQSNRFEKQESLLQSTNNKLQAHVEKQFNQSQQTIHQLSTQIEKIKEKVDEMSGGASSQKQEEKEQQMTLLYDQIQENSEILKKERDRRIADTNTVSKAIEQVKEVFETQMESE